MDGPSFVSAAADSASALSQATVGLVTKEEFTRRREELEADAGKSSDSPAGGKKKKKKAKAGASALSFSQDIEGEEEEPAEELPRKKKLGKAPGVDTSFLPDAEREEALAQRKQELAKEWETQQNAIKAEIVEITYSFWDGKGQRHVVKVPKGFTVAEFLNKCREQVKELRSCSPEMLMYVKEDLILPHNTTFYELIVGKARGKSGPLFNFDVHDDVRVGPLDTRVEKDESHAGKVMEKRLYERNKDKFPYSRFEVYDSTKSYDTYTVHGSETFGKDVNTAFV